MTEMAFIDLGAQQRRLGERLPQAIQRVLDHGQYIMGPEVQEVEEQLADFCGARHAISCASGTDALLLSLMFHGVGPGDAVFVPSFSFVSAAEVVVLLGATPVFVDVDADCFLLDVQSLEQALPVAAEHGLKPRGVIPVDLFGQPADYQAINALASEHGLFVIADAAQSFGAGCNGSKVGTLAPLTTTSFFPAKPLGCYGDGGAIFTDDADIASRLKSLRSHGRGEHKYDHVAVGINALLDTLQAAILLQKLAIFPDEIEQRNRVAEHYTAALAGLVTTPRLREGCASVWSQYTVQAEERDGLFEALGKEGVPTAIYYPRPLHLQSAYRGVPCAPAMSVSERLSSVVLSLPIHPYLERQAQEQVCAAVARVAPGPQVDAAVAGGAERIGGGVASGL